MATRPTAAIVGIGGLTLSTDEAAFFQAADPWGFILFARNVETPEQLRGLTSALRDAVGRDAPVLVDQEGGRVQRLRAPHWREWLPPLDQVTRAGVGAERSLWLRHRLIAEELRAVGIDTNCVPTADIACAETHHFLRNRCLGEDAATVARNARAVAEGTLAGGVLPVMKHMPGHGRAVADSHHDLPEIAAGRSELAASDFAPFRALADLPLGMTAHIRAPTYGDEPATLNPAIIGAIRTEIGFRGLLMTDDISMEALSGGPGERAVRAIAAGCDIVLHCNGEMAEMEQVAAAAGPLSDAAHGRAEAALACRRDPDPVDTALLEAELEALLKGQVHV
ncbi:Beta-hexosaminidase [Defluviimonas aquaemixtae]|uniref:beta-N-acetylhexosaminidase n=2 Tax=Albidovulum aquaemixtae TaxID=1542388 RepID=A0A2R8B6Q3_9RHOB|nr:Beta-hexosaminidase [Defluviimonas aquaemixtae]